MLKLFNLRRKQSITYRHLNRIKTDNLPSHKAAKMLQKQADAYVAMFNTNQLFNAKLKKLSAEHKHMLAEKIRGQDAEPDT